MSEILFSWNFVRKSGTPINAGKRWNIVHAVGKRADFTVMIVIGAKIQVFKMPKIV